MSKPAQPCTVTCPGEVRVYIQVYHVCTACAPRVYRVCSARVPRVFRVCTACVPRVYQEYSASVPRVYLLRVACVYRVCTACVPRVYRVFPRVYRVFPRVYRVCPVCTACVPRVYRVCTACVPDTVGTSLAVTDSLMSVREFPHGAAQSGRFDAPRRGKSPIVRAARRRSRLTQTALRAAQNRITTLCYTALCCVWKFERRA